MSLFSIGDSLWNITHNFYYRDSSNINLTPDLQYFLRLYVSNVFWVITVYLNNHVPVILPFLKPYWVPFNLLVLHTEIHPLSFAPSSSLESLVDSLPVQTVICGTICQRFNKIYPTLWSHLKSRSLYCSRLKVKIILSNQRDTYCLKYVRFYSLFDTTE